MHKLDKVSQACTNALADDAPGRGERFCAAVDPAFVLEMASAIEALLAYVEKVDDLTAGELAREIRDRMDRDRPEGGV